MIFSGYPDCYCCTISTDNLPLSQNEEIHRPSIARNCQTTYDDYMTHPAVQSVLECGYDPSLIKKAYDSFNMNLQVNFSKHRNNLYWVYCIIVPLQTINRNVWRI